MAEVCAIIDLSVLFLLFVAAWTHLDLSRRSNHQSEGELGRGWGTFKTSCHGVYLFLLCERYTDG